MLFLKVSSDVIILKLSQHYNNIISVFANSQLGPREGHLYMLEAMFF